VAPGLWTAPSAERYSLATVPVTHAPWQSSRGVQPEIPITGGLSAHCRGTGSAYRREMRRRFHEEGAS
jgi:hypothetical protein